jgi:acetyltransferase-like isoleucine patch superfamily enzyme
MGLFVKIIKTIVERIYAKRYPVQYIKKIGVNCKGHVKIYGDPYGHYGTEPWIITLGNNVHITKNVEFVTHDGGTLIFRKKYPKLEITKPIQVGNNVYIGINTIILPGVTIGNNVVIGAGSVVTKNIPDNVVAAGVPAKVIKTKDEYLKKLKKDSLEIGNLNGKEKDNALKLIYKYKA